MKSLAKSVSNSLSQIIFKALGVTETPLINLPSSTNPEFASPSVIKLFNANKKTGSFGCSSCKELAEKIAASLKDDPVIKSIQPIAQGGDGKGKKGAKPKDPATMPFFLNIQVHENFVENEIIKALVDGIKVIPEKKLKVLVDFSSPNIAKELHVGHLRSTIIGDTMCRMLEFLGHETLRINHIGDWGTQFGMLTAFLYEQFPDFLSKEPNLGELQSFYQNAKKKFDVDKEFQQRSHENVVKLQSGEPAITKGWQFICDLSRKEFNKIYTRLEIKIQECGESFYNPMIKPIIEELKASKIIEESKGALCIFNGKDKTPLIVQKSDGAFSYDSTDMAAANYRLIKLKCDRIIYVTDIGQEFHFKLIIEAAKKAGWHVPPKTQMEHMGFGLVLGEGGKKIKTRDGGGEKLIDLIDEARDRALEQLQERFKENEKQTEVKTQLKDDKEMKDAAEIIGVAAIKYYDLKQNRKSNYEFSYDRMLDPKGNTAVYLLYTYARLSSILRKANFNLDTIPKQVAEKPLKITNNHEKELAIMLLGFPDVLLGAVEELENNRICDYVYDLSCKFSAFYTECKVIGGDNEQSRLYLVYLVKQMLKTAFGFLGIKPLEKI